MPRIKPDVESFARIRVVGVGGAGGNAIAHMISSKIQGVDFIAVNTDAQDLYQSPANKKIHIGRNITRGLGTGMDPDIGRRAAEESREEIAEALKGADMVFVASGFGGGTGTGAGPVIASIARDLGALSVGVVTKPFSFEGLERARLAEEGLRALVTSVDAMVVIPNDKLFDVIEKQTSFLKAFSMCDEVLRQAVEGISDLITMPGIINVDFADVRSIMRNAGTALMGIGVGSGERRAMEAAERAINSPLLDMSIDGARGVLFSIAGGPDLTMWEINEAARVITEPIAKDARIIFGAMHSDKLKKGEIKVTMIATGFTDDPHTMSKARDEQQATLTPTRSEAKPVPITPAQTPTSAPAPRESVVTKSEAVKEIEEKNDEDEWDAIPAFLRRRR